MDTTLLDASQGSAGAADGSLMRALGPFDSLDERQAIFTIAVEDAGGRIYRVIRTNSFCETIRIFECAKDRGYVVGPGRMDKKVRCHKTLRCPAAPIDARS